MNNFLFFADQVSSDANIFDGLSVVVVVAIIFVSVLIGLAAIFAAVMSIYLAIKYLKFNRKHASCGVKGKDVARQLLDENGLEKIKVVRASIFTAFTVGNSYSHYFKRVRLRGLIYNKDSITSVSMAGQKVGLALLDKEGDPDMKKRIKLVPIVMFGPFAFIPLIAVGFVLDYFVFQLAEGSIFSVIFTCLGLAFYLWAFALSMKTLKTEKKAQDKALVMLKEKNYLNDSELEDAKELYKLYNINYVVDAIISLLEAIREILKILLKILQSANKLKSN